MRWPGRVAGSGSSFLRASIPTTAPVLSGPCSWNAAAGSGCSASRTAPRSSQSTPELQVQPHHHRKGRLDRGDPDRSSCVGTLEDWERAEDLATPYTRAQVERFSPKSRAILEIQSRRDLEILEKIYANSVLLGDDGPDGWGIKYATEFHMTNDSKLFPPRPKWEEKGYRPDEYSRWLKGDWRPIEELWAELGVDPDRPEPAEIELEDWLFDTTAWPRAARGGGAVRAWPPAQAG